MNDSTQPPGRDRSPDGVVPVSDVLDAVGTALRRRLVERSRPSVVFECRRCGTTLDGPDQSCPACQRCDVVRFEVD